MEVCGSVVTNSKYELFRLKCIYCTIESELKDWEPFIFHVRSAHYCDEDVNTGEMEIKPATQELYAAVVGSDSAIDGSDPVIDGSDPVIDASDPNIAYGPDEFFEVIENNNEEDQWMQADNNDGQYLDDDTAWSEPAADFSQYTPDGISSEIPAAADIMELDDTSQNQVPLDEDEVNCSDFFMSEEDFAPPRKAGRPPRRRRPGQVFKFKVSFTRSNPRVLHLIHAYREHPCLWDPSDKNYENEIARNMAYEKIMERMDNKANVLFTVEELKKSIENLHVQYTLAAETQQKEKLVGLAARYFAKCDYLSVAPSIAPKEVEEDDDLTVIKLNFLEENLVTSSFIETYANYPGLYNSELSDFGSVEARAIAYRMMAKEFQPVVKANETDVYIAVNKLRRWLYDAMRRLRSKELIQKCSKQEVEYLRMCSFLPAKGSESQVLYCDYCDKRFHGDYNLRVHIVKAHEIGDLPYLCSLCPRRFDRQVDMDRHKLRTHFERKLKCQYCEKSFAVDNDLKVHTLIHTGERPHVCDICGKTFRLKLLLDHHVNGVHLNIRPYRCDMCNKTFRKKFELANHIKGHLNIRDKKCEYCDAAFYDHSSLSRHRRSHRT
ncbi:putative zinc finger protein 735 [Drosophila eugracilis]|uniref:putative zinc finger protein 735 n=1 Tax=Drosophila eugracilis TaxID=29029 RepID=UPI0007E6190A|nr:putative zinc finger protein 735 [Drosophila eugracilis]